MPINEKGFELPDIKSLVAVCDLRPVSMGDRIHRYIRTPSLKDELIYSDENFDPDDFFDDEDRPMSPHEERAEVFMTKQKERQHARDKKAAEAAAEKLRLENEDFRRRVREVKESIPPTE